MRLAPWIGWWLAACAAAPAPWRADVQATLATSRAAGADLVAFFALPGRAQSDRMEGSALRDDAVLAALESGGFWSLWLDGFTHGRLYRDWIGGGEGMGVCVLDGAGRVYAARPGPQDPPELAAFLRQVAGQRAAIAAARRDLAAAPDDAQALCRLGVQLLELGCRRESEELLIGAAQRGELDAHHRLARLYALDGRLDRARQWLRTALPSAPRAVTEGYVLWKERRPGAAVDALQAALRDGAAGSEALRARLFLGKALADLQRRGEAKAVLEALSRDAGDTTFGAAARHSLSHLEDHAHDHSHGPGSDGSW